MNDEVYFSHVEKHRNILQVDIAILTVRIQTFPKYTKKEVGILLQYLQKNIGGEVVLLSADKYESFLQDDTIILSVCNQTCRKYPK